MVHSYRLVANDTAELAAFPADGQRHNLKILTLRLRINIVRRCRAGECCVS